MAAQSPYNDGPNNTYTVVSPGPIQGTNIACTTLTSSGLTTATAGAVVGTYATSSPAKNPYIEIKHATTDHPLCSYLICRNSSGGNIGGIDQETQTSIKLTAGVVSAGTISASGLISANGGLSSTGTVTGATVVSNGAMSAAAAISADGGIYVSNGLQTDTASVSSGLSCRAPYVGLQTNPGPGLLWTDGLRVGSGAMRSWSPAGP